MSAPYEAPKLTFIGNLSDPKTHERMRELGASPPNCHACTHSYMEPDASYLICGHPDAGTFGLFIRTEPLVHCGWKKFEQHPLRNPDGTIERTIFDDLKSP